ncbi:MAG: aliphatic sulfonates ABC transporter substrate-binding protein, partial [Cyanobacteriota bacterium]|nr:aliphatic sulfonates ABC transporter substrate-binding protein [Cyanobacteriota bacterium]
MKLRSLLSYILLCIVTLILAVSCNNPASNIQTPTETDSSPASAVAADAVRLGFSAWPGWFPWQVAAEEGIFAENEVPVDLTWFDGYLESINTLTAGQIDANSQ